MFDIYLFQRPFSGEAWKEPKIIKPYHDTLPSCHWRVQDWVNAKVKAGLSICEMAELPAVENSFWFTYEELIKQDEKSLKASTIGRKIPWRTTSLGNHCEQEKANKCLYSYRLLAINML